MKYFLAIAFCTTQLFTVVFCLDKISKLSHDLTNEENFNTRRDRRLNWMQAPKNINVKSLGLGFHLEGTAPAVTASLLTCENGPLHVETGSIDKTDYFVHNFPIEERSALEGARTLNRKAWDFFKDNPDIYLKFLLSIAGNYTAVNAAQQAAWARNMQKTTELFYSQIHFTGEEKEPIILLMKTPTPDYGAAPMNSDGSRAARQTAHKRRRKKL